jgi:hypothetical protein
MGKTTPSNLAAPTTITIAIPPIAVPAAVHVHEAPPALVTKRNAAHLGMTRRSSSAPCAR